MTLDPAPADPRGYGTDSPRLARVAAPVLRLFDRRRLRMLPAPPGRLIEVGAGRGRFARAAIDAGWDVVAIEPSAGAVEAAASVYGVELLPSGLEEVSLAPGAADALVMWHVLEHLGEGFRALRLVHGWLRPDGLVLIGVPNVASWQARLGGSRWFHRDEPRHRVHFTPLGLRLLLERSGFSVVSERHLLLEHNPFGMWQTLVNRVTREPSWLFAALQRRAPVWSRDALVTALALPLLPLAVLLELAAGLARRGGTIAVLARRDAD